MSQIDVMTDLYNRLKTITGVSNVYDSIAPSNATSPYIVISSSSKYDGRLLNNTEKRLSITINVWSSYKGKKEIYTISNAIYELLETDYDFISEQTLIDPISNWSRAILTYEYFYESNGGNK